MNSPAQSTSVVGNDNIVVQASGSGVNVTVQSGRPYLRLTQFEERTRRAAQANSETSLLSPYRTDVVPLIGRDREMSDLRRWLDDPAAISVRVLVGAGGRGKTRLASELARAISKDGWLAGFATERNLDLFRDQHDVAEWRWDKPVLVIVDDAASRAGQIRDWINELVNAPLGERPKLRLLLLERQANTTVGWFVTIFGRGDDDASGAAIGMLDPPKPADLRALDELEFRRVVFATLLKRSNGALEAPALDADPQFKTSLRDEKWAGDPLYLMMAGIAAAKAGVQAALSLSRADLALSMARNELDRIGRIGAARGIDAKLNHPGAFVRHMAVMATLVQGLTRAGALALATTERATLGSAAELNATIEALTDALPESDANDSVAPILPDIVGEGAILAWLGPKGGIGGSRDPQPRIAAAASVSMAKVSSTLVRTAQDFAAAGYVEPIRWLEALAGASERDIGALFEIANALPQQTLALREMAAALYQRIVRSLEGPSAAEASAGHDFVAQALYATTLSNLGNRLRELGRREEALAASREAIQIHHRLADWRPDIFQPGLANALYNFGNNLSDGGQRGEALAAAREATGIYRRLAAEQPDAFLPDFALSLNGFSVRLREVDRPDDALAAAREATDISRRLAAEQPDAFLPNLATSLNTLGGALSGLGRHEDAFAAAGEMVDIHRRLAAERPDAFVPDLAQSLNNLGKSLSALGRRDETLAAAREAIDIFRRLAAERPDAFLPDLAQSLQDLGYGLNELGRREEALGATHEAAAALGPVFLRLPAAHAQTMKEICKQYFKLSQSIGVEMDGGLLNPILDALRELRGLPEAGPSSGP